MSEIPNPQIELAYQYIQNTNTNIFLTGKAGTGKTTFLHRIKRESNKRLAVVAPTGVAAINAKGMTIHSLFQLPFGAFVPGSKSLEQQRKFSRQKIALIRSLDLLIIDEISMVRSDLLDAIDDVLRKYKDRTKPFGGVQLLMIGDLHQLPPVVKPDEWQMIRKFYKTPYFFGSLALQQTRTITIQLKHIYRQSDRIFIDLLNKVRNNNMTQDVFNQLNSRYIPNFEPKEDDGYITLSSHNATANNINSTRLSALTTKQYIFKATVKGDFPKHNFPTLERLELKVGAQVVFIKNDISGDKRFYNGKIGQIVEIKSEEVIVKCPGDLDNITVGTMEWQNVKYNLNESKKEVEEDVIGRFEQFPLKLAWAITIHKSQGLTFDKAIIDAKSAFAHGQVYVALSRCRSFEGIVLMSKIGQSSVKTDRVVSDYSAKAEKNEPTESDLEVAKQQYQQDLIRELFDFRALSRNIGILNKFMQDNDRSYSTSPLPNFKAFIGQANAEVVEIAAKFLRPLENYFRQNALPEEHEALLERLGKASQYFSDKLKVELLPQLNKVPIITDNQSVRGRTEDGIEAIERVLFLKNAAFEVAQKGFDTTRYVKVKANADLDFTEYKRQQKAVNKLKKVPSDSPHPKLHAELLQWREETAEIEGKSDYEVLPSRSMNELVESLPTSSKNLKKISGIGDVKLRMYGAEIIDIIERYCTNNNLIANTLKIPFSKKPTKKKKGDTKEISFNAYKAGKKIAEIADQRGMTQGTITSHLAHYVGLGKIDIYELMEEEAVDEIGNFFRDNLTTSRKEAKDHFGDKYDYNDLKMVLAYLESEEE
ncbi:MAG: helix-turn-helix domain-containing protein [Saprospiraceae bacterium]